MKAARERIRCERLVVPVRGGGGSRLTDDVILRRPEGNVDGIQGSEQGETPGDALNDRAVAIFGELVDDGSEEKQVDDRPGKKTLNDCAGTHNNDDSSPNGKSPRRGGNIGLLAPVVCTIPSRRETEDIRPQEEEIHNDIDDLPSRSE